MKKALLLYNPKAGNRQITHELDVIAKKMQEKGYSLTIYRSDRKYAIRDYIINYLKEEVIDVMLISGGDGTLNECINGMMTIERKIPLLILPLGTANDFAYSAQIPSSVEEALSLLDEGQLKAVDIGKVNGQYFINVCNMGLFSGVSHNIDLELKKKFGKLAYYVKSLEELQGYKAMDMKIQVDDQTLKGEYALVLVFNGKAAGGFTKIAKHADIYDGLFDIVCIKKVELYDVPLLFLKTLQGDHLNNPNIDYLVGKHIEIECYNDEHHFATDFDGEVGPRFPLTIDSQHEAIEVYLPALND